MKVSDSARNWTDAFTLLVSRKVFLDQEKHSFLVTSIFHIWEAEILTTRWERLVFVQKIILKLGLVAISESLYTEMIIYPKLCLTTRKTLWYKLIIGLCICLFSLNFYNVLHCTPTHYHPLALIPNLSIWSFQKCSRAYWLCPHHSICRAQMCTAWISP